MTESQIERWQQEDFDNFDAVRQNSTLSHRNVNELMRIGYLDLTSKTHKDYEEEDRIGKLSISAIGPTSESREGLRDDILRSLSRPNNDKISLALCSGEIDRNRHITGDAHWFTLHIKKETDAQGKITLKPYYVDSLGGHYKRRIESLMKEINECTAEKINNIAAGETRDRILGFLEQRPTITKVTQLPCQQQQGVNCGYHAVFNALSLHDTGEIQLDEAQNFVNRSKEELKKRFPAPQRAPRPQPQTSTTQIPPQTSSSQKPTAQNIRDLTLQTYQSDSSYAQKLQGLKKLELLARENGLNSNQANIEKYLQKTLTNLVSGYILALFVEESQANNEQVDQILTLFDIITTSKTFINSLDEKKITQIAGLHKQIQSYDLAGVIEVLQEISPPPPLPRVTRKTKEKSPPPLPPKLPSLQNPENPAPPHPRQNKTPPPTITPESTTQLTTQKQYSEITKIIEENKHQPTSQIKRQINQAVHGQKNPPSYCGIGAKADVSFNQESGSFTFKITKIIPNSYAQTHGIKIGDTITIANYPALTLANANDVTTAIRNLDTDQYQMTITKSGQTQATPFPPPAKTTSTALVPYTKQKEEPYLILGGKVTDIQTLLDESRSR